MSLHIKSLSFSYDKKIIFSDVNLKLDSGKIYYLKGANGEGKTSFLNLIAGLEKPRKGEISFGKVKFVSDSDYIFDRSFTMSLGFFPAKNNSMFFKTLLPIATLLCDVDELICGNSTTFSASNNLGLT